MYKLYQYALCPLSRQIRVYLSELSLKAHFVKDTNHIQLNTPISPMPTLEVNSSLFITGISPITEYMVDTHKEFFLMPKNDPIKSARIRECLCWFNEKFHREITQILINEKVVRQQYQPRSNFLARANSNLLKHLEDITKLLEKNKFIISENISCADIACACHISVVDYFGEIRWDMWHSLKEWYCVIKSRPSFRGILKDRMAGFNPSETYSMLDF